MMERAEIIVRGRVQRVGYRDYVAEVGNRLDLGGRVSNLPDKTVQIIAEGERRVLDEFISLLKPKDDPLIKVTGSDVKFEKATGEFEYFDLEYGDFTAEGFERIGVAASYLKSIDRKQDRMLDKQDSMLDKQDVMIGKQDETIEKIDSGNKLLAEKIDSGNEMLGGKIDSGNKLLAEKIDSGNEMLGGKIDSGNKLLAEKIDCVSSKIDSGFGRMDRNFTALRSDYGRISRTMEKILDKLTEQQKDVVESNDRLCEAILKLAEKRA